MAKDIADYQFLAQTCGRINNALRVFQRFSNGFLQKDMGTGLKRLHGKVSMGV